MNPFSDQKIFRCTRNCHWLSLRYLSSISPLSCCFVSLCSIPCFAAPPQYCLCMCLLYRESQFCRIPAMLFQGLPLQSALYHQESMLAPPVESPCNLKSSFQEFPGFRIRDCRSKARLDC